MKTIPNQFTGDNNDNFVQVKKNEKAALYRRSTPEGSFVSFEVFALLLNPSGDEVYPNQAAMSKWAWCPISEDRANKMFDDITSGAIVIGPFNPETSELPDLTGPSLEELMAQDDPTVPSTPAVETPVVDVSLEATPAVEVAATPDGGAVVTVAKVKKTKVEFSPIYPEGEFDQAIFARANGLPERGVVWSRLDDLVKAGKLSKVLRPIGKGRPKQFFTKIEAAPAVATV